MLSKLLAVAFWSSLTFASPEAEKRQAQATDEAGFNSAVSQLLSLYIPPAVSASLVNVISSAASATGDLNEAVQSAFAAPTAPAYLSQIPSEYQSNVASLQSAISELRGVASTGIAGAPVVTTDSAGATVTSIKESVASAASDAASSGAVPTDAIVTTDASSNTITGLAALSTGTDGSVVTSLTTTFPVSSSPVPGSDPAAAI
ncbi:MAG: hypothetical protein M1837_005593 [Sclerophora amabilis]|nr:MAG: hypothetical protein M1837_005593 [Sclerophora amabilis]